LGLLLYAVGVGCGGSGSPPAGAIDKANGGIDEATITSMAAGYASLNRVNQVPFRSMAGQQPHAEDPMVDVYVNATALGVYESIDPALANPAGPFPEGTLVVKRNEAKPPFLTAMYKAKAGYDPAHADWWYGRLNEDGTSTGYTGKVDFCIACHSGRAAEDYVFGVATTNRRP
jgi:hypothetical protein